MFKDSKNKLNSKKTFYRIPSEKDGTFEFSKTSKIFFRKKQTNTRNLNFSINDIRLISNLRGIPEEEISFLPKMHSVKSGDETIEKIMQFIAKKQNPMENIILRNWHLIVSPPFDLESIPVQIIDNKKLIIKVNSPSIRQELNFKKNRILSNIRSIKNCESIKEIAFLLG